MTYDFNVYPCGGRVGFVRAKLDEVKQMMTDYPQDWNCACSTSRPVRHSGRLWCWSGRNWQDDFDANCHRCLDAAGA